MSSLILSSPLPLVENDEALDLADKIRAEVEVFQTVAPPVASLSQENLKQLVEDKRYVMQRFNTLEAELQELEAQGQNELTALWKNIRPLQLRLKSIADALQISKAFQALEQRLKAEIAEVKEASLALAKQFLPYNLPEFEKGMESFMDRCDEIADQLDRYESLGYPIDELEPLYNQWMTMIESYGELLDTQIEALRPANS